MAVDVGFADPIHGSQMAFRTVLTALSGPGMVCPLPATCAGQSPLPAGVAEVLLTLADFETTLFFTPDEESPQVPTGAFGAQPSHEDQSGRAREYVVFHTGAPIAGSADAADFVVASPWWLAAHLPVLRAGTAEYPDRSATCIVPLESWQADAAPIEGAGVCVRLTGPGLRAPLFVASVSLDAAFWAAAVDNAARYPGGVDFIFCTPAGVVGLPRSTTIDLPGDAQFERSPLEAH
ncbi:MAG: phosphonate C-P lyase system protein PhnH [Pseudomonadota bacterium]